MKRAGANGGGEFGEFPRTRERIAAGEITDIPTDAEVVELDPALKGAPHPAALVAVADGVAGRRAQDDKVAGVFRENKPVAKSPASKRIAKKRNAIVAKALAGADSPLDVLIDNMRWAIGRARKLEAVSAGIESGGDFENIARLREMADASAYRAAPYVHSKMAPIVPKGEKGLVVNFVIEDA